MNTGKANELFIQVKRVGFAALIDEENLTHFFRHYHKICKFCSRKITKLADLEKDLERYFTEVQRLNDYLRFDYFGFRSRPKGCVCGLRNS